MPWDGRYTSRPKNGRPVLLQTSGGMIVRAALSPCSSRSPARISRTVLTRAGPGPAERARMQSSSRSSEQMTSAHGPVVFPAVQVDQQPVPPDELSNLPIDRPMLQLEAG
jgi:hypothetical protein